MQLLGLQSVDLEERWEDLGTRRGVSLDNFIELADSRFPLSSVIRPSPAPDDWSKAPRDLSFLLNSQPSVFLLPEVTFSNTDDAFKVPITPKNVTVPFHHRGWSSHELPERSPIQRSCAVQLKFPLPILIRRETVVQHSSQMQVILCSTVPTWLERNTYMCNLTALMVVSATQNKHETSHI